MVQWQSININNAGKMMQASTFRTNPTNMVDTFDFVFSNSVFMSVQTGNCCSRYGVMADSFYSRVLSFWTGILAGLNISQSPINTFHLPQYAGLNPANQILLQNPGSKYNHRPAQNSIPLKQAVQEAVKTINENFETLGLPEEAKTYLSNIEYADEPFGTARADISNGKIIVNTANTSANPADMAKVLIHESLHCVNKSPFSSREEEFNCEKQAIQSVAKLIKSGALEDCQIYNHSMSALGSDEAVLDKALTGWLDAGGYDNRIIDSAGNVNIEQYEIHSNDIIRIDGKDYGRIGEHFLEGIQSSSICQMFSVDNNQANTKGIVVFDNTTQKPDEIQRFLPQKNNPHKIEIIRNGEVVCTGTVYNMRDELI